MLLFLIIGGAFAVFAVAIADLIGKQKAANQLREKIAGRFATDELYVSAVDQSAIGINFADQYILLGKGENVKPYPFARISSVEVMRDGATVSQTNRGSQVAGAAIGGLALGGLGALVGGLSGSRTIREKVSAIRLKVTVEDNYNPVHVIAFLGLPRGQSIEPTATVAKAAFEATDRLHAHIVNAMRQADRAAPSNPIAAQPDQLERLWNMRQAGALSDEEFAEQKRLLLGSQLPAATTSLPTESSRRYRVILVGVGPDAYKFVKALSEQVPEMSASTRKGLGNLPAVLLTGVGETRARRVKEALLLTGAIVEIE